MPTVKRNSFAPHEPYAYGQWVAFKLSYTGEGSLYIRNASLPWGKWYDYPDKDREVAAPNGQAVAPGSIVYVAACGQENSPSGTEGTFEIWSSTSKVAHCKHGTFGSSQLLVPYKCTRINP
ncbi:hypothetical protein KP509_22G019600 [Ceratopteris richardii]|uniref:Uncharacterized protein n=1 Tax=Ceratopteris richardii TaxID=49495 RepID=A0A8T2S6C8_CERRI|nr:hypothetical protein KP509_22G019600 [Ceratopteris richardii]